MAGSTGFGEAAHRCGGRPVHKSFPGREPLSVFAIMPVPGAGGQPFVLLSFGYRIVEGNALSFNILSILLRGPEGFFRGISVPRPSGW